MSNAPTTYGLTQAHLLATANNLDVYQPKSYLSDDQWWGNKAQAPAQTQWQAPGFQKLDYRAAPDYQTYAAQAPTYAGLSGGDYDRYELNLRAPGETAATKAYRQAKTDLEDAYSARGMYGSSQFTNQMSNGLQSNYMDTLAGNAAQATANRYQMEQKDLQYAQDSAMQAWAARMAENQAANQQAQRAWEVDYGNRLGENNLMNQYAYRSSVDQRDWNDQTANRQIDYNNSLAQDRQNWDLSRLGWDANQNDRRLEPDHGHLGQLRSRGGGLEQEDPQEPGRRQRPAKIRRRRPGLRRGGAHRQGREPRSRVGNGRRRAHLHGQQPGRIGPQVAALTRPGDDREARPGGIPSRPPPGPGRPASAFRPGGVSPARRRPGPLPPGSRPGRPGCT